MIRVGISRVGEILALVSFVVLTGLLGPTSDVTAQQTGITTLTDLGSGDPCLGQLVGIQVDWQGWSAGDFITVTLERRFDDGTSSIFNNQVTLQLSNSSGSQSIVIPVSSISDSLETSEFRAFTTDGAGEIIDSIVYRCDAQVTPEPTTQVTPEPTTQVTPEPTVPGETPAPTEPANGTPIDTLTPSVTSPVTDNGSSDDGGSPAKPVTSLPRTGSGADSGNGTVILLLAAMLMVCVTGALALRRPHTT